MTKTERQQSEVKISLRNDVRFSNSGLSWSAGICDNACCSVEEMKSKNTPGIKAKSAATPAVNRKLIRM